MHKLILSTFLVFINLLNLNGQELVPQIMRNLFLQKSKAKSVIVNTTDTSFTYPKNRIDSNFSKHEYYCTINNDKRYYYMKLYKFIDNEYLIYDTVAYWRAGEKCLKYKPEELMPYFGVINNFFLELKRDTFNFQKGDSFIQMNNNRIEYKVKREMFGEMVSFEINYYFDNNGIIKRETNFNNAGIKQTHFTTFTSVNCEKKTNYATLKKLKQIYLEFSELEKNQDTSSLVEVSKLWVKNDTLPTYTKEHISNKAASISIDSLIEKHKLNILYFSFAGCKPCHILKPYLDTFLFKYESSGLNIVGFNNIDSKAYVDSIQTKYPTYYHSKNLDEELEIHLYPMLILMDNNHKILAKMRGVNPPSLLDLERFIKTYLNL